MVQHRVGGCSADRVRREFDASDGREVGREQDREEAAATVGVDEVGRRRRVVPRGGWKEGVSDVVGQRDEDGIVVLEKGMARELKVGVADAFANRCFVVGDANVLGRVIWGGRINRNGGIEGVAEKKGDALFVGPDVSVASQRRRGR